MRFVPLLTVLSASLPTWAEDAFGLWKTDPVRSAALFPDLVAVRFEPHAKGEAFTLETADPKGRSISSSTILYFNGKPHHFQDSRCSGTQSSRRVDDRTVEIQRDCESGQRIRFLRRLGGGPGELILEITEQPRTGRRQERRLILKKESEVGAAVPDPAAGAAQPVIVAGTGDPNIDVPAVQAAIDQGGQVILRGHFSFDRLPATPAGEDYRRMITVSKRVAISGERDGQGDLATIEGGFVPFYVEAPGSRISIERLRFVHPKGVAIWVFAASGATINGCRIEGVEPSTDYASYGAQAHPLASAIKVSSTGPLPTAARPGQPERLSGSIWISNNDIDVGGTASDQTLGIAVMSAGKAPNKEADVYIFGNHIRNITERAINLYLMGGRVHIERNSVTTGRLVGPAGGATPDAIHVVGPGSYLIAHNSIVSQWSTGAGIRVQGQGQAGLPESGAIVVDNEVNMVSSDGIVFGDNSSAIEIRGLAESNLVSNNRIRGRARAALAVAGHNGRNNTLASNHLDGFQPSLADVFIGAGATLTVMVADKARIEDRGAGTITVPPARQINE